MAEVIGITSGLAALTAYAFKSSIALFETVQSFKSYPTRVRELIEEIEALTGVLGTLNETVNATTDIDLSSLKMPLKRCGDACTAFEQVVTKHSSRAEDGRRSFRDWAKLQYMRGDIDGFKRLLAGYRMTIIVALTDANL